MINVDKLGAYYFPLDKKPRGNELTLELYSELSLSSIVFDEIGGEVVGDYFLTTINSGMTEQISNGEYNYTLYDKIDGEKVGIGLIRFDLEEGGQTDDEEYVVYQDDFDGYVQAIELTTTAFTENGVYEAQDKGWHEVTVNIDTDWYYTSGYTDGYSSGYTEGFEDGEENKMNWFYFQAREDGSKVRFRTPRNPSWTVALEYSLDKMDWNTWDFSELTLNSGDTIYFRGNNPNGFNDAPASGRRYCFETPSGSFDIGGDIRSLIDTTISVTTPPDWGFAYLFNSCNIIETNKNLLNGFSALKGGCFMRLFDNCTNLISVPDLPWKTLEGECYNGIFNACRSLTTAPYIAATALRGYKPFTSMFNGCSSLSYVKCLISNPQEVHFPNWLRNVSPTGTFVRDYNATWSTGINGIPEGWTVLVDNVPESALS